MPEVRFEPFAYVPALAADGQRLWPLWAAEPTRHATPGRPEVTPVNNEGVSPLSCARTHGGGEETTTLR